MSPVHHRHACALVRREGLQIDGPAPDFRGTSRSTRDGLLAEFRRAAVLRPGRRRRRERHGQQQAGCDLHGGSVHWRIGPQMHVDLGRDHHLARRTSERIERVLVAQHGKGHGVAVGEAHDDAQRIAPRPSARRLRRPPGGRRRPGLVHHQVKASFVQAAVFDGASIGDFLGKRRRR